MRVHTSPPPPAPRASRRTPPRPAGPGPHTRRSADRTLERPLPASSKAMREVDVRCVASDENISGFLCLRGARPAGARGAGGGGARARGGGGGCVLLKVKSGGRLHARHSYSPAWRRRSCSSMKRAASSSVSSRLMVSRPAARGSGAPAVTPRLATRAAAHVAGAQPANGAAARASRDRAAPPMGARRGATSRGAARSMPLQRSNACPRPQPVTRHTLALFI
ncbi:hypothetical protein PYW07_008698 [Mythimna separata]|uniref:Uncharacterized protein n=1 Tax=Mythimna separata TaxID=271217 RepID=A0AAD7YDN6_MYTSE|nr:hypothetical protein PYW07_008698 [Mythimna separata]